MISMSSRHRPSLVQDLVIFVYLFRVGVVEKKRREGKNEKRKREGDKRVSGSISQLYIIALTIAYAY